MKKLSILLLLTAVLASFAFAIEGVGDFTAAVEFSAANVTGANDGDPAIGIEPYITWSRSFGGLGLAVTLGDYLEITTADVDDTVKDELYVKIVPSYTVEAGPGTLAFSLILKPVFGLANYGGDSYVNFVIDPVVNYTLGLSPGALFFEVGTDDLVIAHDGEDDVADPGYGVNVDDLYFKAGFNFGFGLGIWASPRLRFAVGENADAFHEVRADVSYTIKAVKFGVEGRIRAGDYIKTGGIMLKPHVDLGFGAFAAWAAVEIDGIANDVSADATIKPIVGVSYSF